MLPITEEYKENVYKAMMAQRQLFEGSNGAFAKSLGLSSSIFSRIHNGERDGVLRDVKWAMIGEELGVPLENRKWVTARTEVFNTIEEDIMYCKAFSKSRIIVDDCGIGKTYTAKYLSKQLRNCFYLDASQAKTLRHFTKLLARVVGVESRGVTYYEIKQATKFQLLNLEKPVVIIDEAGDLEYKAFLDLKELWNATEGKVGWYLMGADGLRAKIERGIGASKVGYAEIFSRFSEKFTTVTPPDKTERKKFYRRLIIETLKANRCPADQINDIVRRCIIDEKDGNFYGGLRRAESLLILHNNNQ